MGSSVEHVDVLIVGAGLSGIGAAARLTMECPSKTFAVVEMRDSLGGTWDLFRYPGLRSDSDMFTLGYGFKVWKGRKSIADGADILEYIKETARDYNIDDKIRYHRKGIRASWSTADAQWTVDLRNTENGELEQITCSFLYGTTGYYDYDDGYTPDFPGIQDYAGQVVHPQHWPQDLDYAGKRIVVIGSGATAITLGPSLAKTAEHVTMLQRSPTYIVSQPAVDPVAEVLRRVLPDKTAYSVIRWKNVTVSQGFYELCQRWPAAGKKIIRQWNTQLLPKGFDVDTHFKPDYTPWDQRLCAVPNGDLFRAIGKGTMSVVTDHIDTFTEKGIRLASGEELEADIVVTATGLKIKMLGGAQLSLDGEPVVMNELIGYKGMMFCGIPNAAIGMGYTNASWTLKADLVAQYVCRVLKHMDATGTNICVPQAPPVGSPTHPFVDLKSGYVLRALDEVPKQGDTTPWRLHQNYLRDIFMLRRGSVDDSMKFLHSDAADRLPASA